LIAITQVNAVIKYAVSLAKVLAILTLLVEGRSSAQKLPARFRHTLKTYLNVSDSQLKTIEEGGIVALSAKTGKRAEIMLVGITRIWATPQAFVNSYKNISAFEAGPGITSSGKFSSPPLVADLKNLKFSKAEIDGLRKCIPGKCNMKFDDETLLSLQRTINWDSPNYLEEASNVLRRAWAHYLDRYLQRGNTGLPVYHDASEYVSVEQGVSSLLEKATLLKEYSPALLDFLRHYPVSPGNATDDFFYWQVAAFGLKPVHRMSHVAIQMAPATFGDAYIIGSKMLYASHYFRSAFEVKLLVPGQDQRTGGMHYLVAVQNSYVDGMTGFRGRILRSIAVKRAQSAMERYLGATKGRIERTFNKPTQNAAPDSQR